jgi:hypothetical protein
MEQQARRNNNTTPHFLIECFFSFEYSHPWNWKFESCFLQSCPQSNRASPQSNRASQAVTGWELPTWPNNVNRIGRIDLNE